jgi:putative PIN family toxin of toxin-antitoxin system
MKLRAVFDTNVYLSAVLKPGGYADLWLKRTALNQSGFDLYISKQILDEVKDKLFTEFEPIPKEISQEFIDGILEFVKIVKPTETITDVKDDPDDNMILECAVAAQAQLIVSADKHLLKLNPYMGIGITHPRELKNIFAGDVDGIKKLL